MPLTRSTPHKYRRPATNDPCDECICLLYGFVAGQKNLKTAYAYWLKANASLKSMGIYELPLPDSLQSYQASLGFDE